MLRSWLTVALALLSIRTIPGAQSICPLKELDLSGLYTDRASYGPGETLSIAANWPGKSVFYRVLRVGNLGGPAAWEEKTRTAAVAYGAQQTPPYGSYVEFPNGPSLSGWTSFTLEGWIYPTLVGQDQVAIAGQLGSGAGLNASAAGIGTDKTGKLVGLVKTNGVVTRITDTTPLVPGTWTYVALTYQGLPGGALRLYRAAVGECLMAPRAQKALSGAVGATPYLFRLGARAEASGDLTGCFDGRIDRWGVWSAPLSRGQLQQRMNEGLDPGQVLSCAPTPPPLASLELFADFEDAYGDTVKDGTLKQHDGRIVHHGTPGVAGRPSSGRALRLNHDQVVDAEYERADANQAPPPVVSLTVDPAWSSGLYAIQAVFADQPVGSGANLSAEHFQAFVVRPVAPQVGDPPRPIAVVVPVNTWMAYNSWPGAQGIEQTMATAKGLTLRLQSGVCISQGNNSVYGDMGDGVSHCNYAGWRRPNLWASPVEKLSSFLAGYSPNRRDAPLDAQFFEWLEHPTGGILAPGTIDYDAFTDLDLDDGTLPPEHYRVLMLVGHQEYWSASMVAALAQFLESGGSVISAGGNMIVWRAELAVRAGNEILEVRKWPTEPMLGEHDAFSTIREERTGLWRFLEACSPTGPAYEDYLLGTQGDITGGFCNSDPSHFGLWQVSTPKHWLWGGSVQHDEKLTEIGTVVGDEVDGFIDLASLSCAFPSNPPAALPALFPFSTDQQVTVLARGVDFEALTPTRCGFLAVNWCHPAFDITSALALDSLAGGASLLSTQKRSFADGHGSIVTYQHTGGGMVLSLGAIDSPCALHLSIADGNRLSALVERALACMLDPLACPR